MFTTQTNIFFLHNKEHEKKAHSVEMIQITEISHGKHTLMSFDLFPRLLSVLVIEAFTPSMWVPPSTVRILLAYPSIVSEYASALLIDIMYKEDEWYSIC